MRAYLLLLLLLLSVLTTGGGATLRGEGGDGEGGQGGEVGDVAPIEEDADTEVPNWHDRSSCAALPAWLHTLMANESPVDCTWVRYNIDKSDIVEKNECECLPPHMVLGHQFKQRCQVEGTCVTDQTCAEEPMRRCFVNWQLCVAGGTATAALLFFLWLCCRACCCCCRCCCCRRKGKDEDIEKRLRRRRRRSWCWSRRCCSCCCCCCSCSWCRRHKDEPAGGLYGRTFALEKQRGGPAVTGVAFV